MESRIFRRFVDYITEGTTSFKYQTARIGLLASIILIMILSVALAIFEAVEDYNNTMGQPSKNL